MRFIPLQVFHRSRVFSSFSNNFLQKNAFLAHNPSNRVGGNFSQSRHFSYSGFYASLSQSTPVVTLQTFLVEMHETTGLPWWAVTLLTTLSIRTFVVFPLTVHQHQVMARLVNINVEIGKLVPDLNKEVNIAKSMYKLNEKNARKVFKRQLKVLHNRYVVRDNCHPFKTFLLAIIQVPMWVCFSVSLRNLTYIAQTESYVPESLKLLQSEGLLWFSNLTQPDPVIIPLLLLAVNLSVSEIHALRQMSAQSLLQKVLVNTSRIVILIVAAAATINPSSVTFYWLCSSTCGLIQNVFLMSPKFRRVLRIPHTAQESPTPFKDISDNFKKQCQSWNIFKK